MRRTNNKPEVEKTCPLLDEKCLKAGCEIYNEMLNRCEIGLTAYNLYLLADVMKRQLGATSEPGGTNMKQRIN
jgi:hypothetical protein